MSAVPKGAPKAPRKAKAPKPPAKDAPALFDGMAPLRGQSHANRGLPFEQALEWQHERYKAAGWFITRNQPKIIVIKHPMAKIVSKAPPDWQGVRCPEAFLIDAKHQDNMPFYLDKIPGHQAAAFDAAITANMIAGIVAQLGDQVWWLSWSEIGPLWHTWHDGYAARGEASLDAVGLAAHGERVVGFDWLTVATGGSHG